MLQNGQLLAVFNSAHRVMKAESVLKGQKLPVLLIPSPRAISNDCGLAIRYDDEFETPVMQTLREQNILPALVYRRITEVEYETVWKDQDSPTALPYEHTSKF
jgi:hypothetical protein